MQEEERAALFWVLCCIAVFIYLSAQVLSFKLHRWTNRTKEPVRTPPPSVIGICPTLQGGLHGSLILNILNTITEQSKFIWNTIPPLGSNVKVLLSSYSVMMRPLQGL